MSFDDNCSNISLFCVSSRFLFIEELTKNFSSKGIRIDEEDEMNGKSFCLRCKTRENKACSYDRSFEGGSFHRHFVSFFARSFQFSFVNVEIIELF